MNAKHPLFGVILIFGFTLCSVFAYLSVKHVFLIDPSISPINAIFWGFLGATIVSGFFNCSRKKERKLVQQEWSKHKKLIITISIMSGIGAILWAWSLHIASAGTVGLIGRADVLMALALGTIFLGERFSWKEIVGAIIAICGLCVVANLPNEISLLAVGIVLCTRFLYAMQSFFVKKSGQNLRGIPFTFCRILIMTLVLLITVLVTGTFSVPPLILLIFLVSSQVLGAFVGRVLYFEAHKYLGIGHINLLSLLQPVLLLIGTWLLLNEPMPAQKIVGGGILLLGLAIIVLEKWKRDDKKFSLKRIFATLRGKKDDLENPVDLS